MALDDAIHEVETGNDFQESKYRGLKLILSNLAVIEGAVLSGIGRATGAPEIIALPIFMDFFFGSIPFLSPLAIDHEEAKKAKSDYIKGYAMYALGATLPYVDKIYAVSQDLLGKL